MSATANNAVQTINGDMCYIGADRRIDRRRSNSNRRLEALLSDFGLDRRIKRERRDRNASWFIMSDSAS
ncbi:MAG: hypothetical protein V2I33_04245 [Kangiellaceae bacterium]|nr:hypothetical protein [Kangiellaceae bacterium]